MGPRRGPAGENHATPLSPFQRSSVKGGVVRAQVAKGGLKESLCTYSKSIVRFGSYLDSLRTTKLLHPSQIR